MLRAFTKEQRKQIHTIMNAADNLHDDNDVINFALSAVAQMCAPEVIESNAVFYITTNDEGDILLEMDV